MKEPCVVCFEETRTKLDCGHAIHKKCLSRTLKAFGENGMIIPWRCPVPDCNKKYNPYGLLNIEKINRHIERLKEFFKIIEDKKDVVIDLSEKGKYLLLPCEDRSCKGLVPTGGEQNGKCYICNIEYCKKCYTRHEGKCDKNAVSTIKERKLKQKNCPRCGICIEKNEGCDHMTCVACKYEFWWKLYTPFKENQEMSSRVFMERKTKKGDNVGSSKDITCAECGNVCSNLMSRMCCYCIDKKSDFEKVRKFVKGKFTYVDSSDYYCSKCKENHFS